MATIPTQVLGISMGFPNAPPCSMATCRMKENFPTAPLFLTLPTDSSDILLLEDASCQQIRPSEWTLQIKIRGNCDQQDCYDKNLSLIPENFEDGYLKFLEGTSSINFCSEEL